jgi:hypothetical protein
MAIKPRVLAKDSKEAINFDEAPIMEPFKFKARSSKFETMQKIQNSKNPN